MKLPSEEQAKKVFHPSVCIEDNSGLDRTYTVFGEVFRGMDVVDKIVGGTVNDNVWLIDGDDLINNSAIRDIKFRFIRCTEINGPYFECLDERTGKLSISAGNQIFHA